MIHLPAEDGTEFRPPRPNGQRIKCALCTRVFAAGHIPAPMIGGRHDGALVCRDCRRALEVQDTAPPGAPGLF